MESKFEDQLPYKYGEEENSPECLLPAKDPYSSEDEQIVPHGEATIKDSKKSKFKKTTLFKITIETISLMQIVKGFRVNFLFTPKQPSMKEFDEFDISDALTSLLSFISADSITAANAIQAVLDFETDSPPLRWLHYYKRYKFPNVYEGSEIHLKREFTWIKKKMDKILEKMANVEEKISKNQNVYDEARDKSYEHDCAKSFFHEFFSCCWDGNMYNSECDVTLNLPVTSLEGANEHDTLSKLYNYNINLKVSSKPDIVIGEDYHNPVIPVEVFCPQKVSGEREEAHKNDSEYRESSSSECCDSVAIKKFINENMPNFEFVDSQRLLGRIKTKLTQQLLMQLLGCSYKYLRTKMYPKKNEAEPLYRKRHCFLGFLVFQCFVYIIKLEGTNMDIHFSCDNDVDWQRDNQGKYPLDVCFFPVPLDVRKPSHGIALLFFIKYYRNIFEHDK